MQSTHKALLPYTMAVLRRCMWRRAAGRLARRGPMGGVFWAQGAGPVWLCRAAVVGGCPRPRAVPPVKGRAAAYRPSCRKAQKAGGLGWAGPPGAAMPGFTCCVPGCYNNSHRDEALHFYTFPKDAELRRLWLKNVSRGGISGCFSTFQPTTGHRLCSVHFQGGRKTYTVRVPTIFPLRRVNERKVPHRPAGAAAARRRRQRRQQQQSPSASTAQTAQLQPNLVSASAAVLLTLQAAVDSSQALGSVPPAPTTPTGEDVKPIDLTVQVEFAAAEGAAAASELEAATAGLEAAKCPTGPQLVVVGEEGFPDTGSDHLYSLSGTTEEELLRKLNEQWDILALMEVKMKEMKGSIRHLRLTEAKLREELHEKDQLLAMAVIRKKHGM